MKCLLAGYDNVDRDFKDGQFYVYISDSFEDPLISADLKKIHGERDMSGTSTTTKNSIPPAMCQRSIPLDLASSSLRW